ncbi:MAG TPA: hemin uptake protein HemP [Pirellulaceae bacterium]|jgi:hemin uptake protein HemP|nr:hemin uptake protein HemP [Pirellulaceae bacterium]
MSVAYAAAHCPSSANRPARSDRPAPPESRPAELAPQERPRYDSAELLQGRKEALIEHGGEIYRLRLTGSGKLYLTK